MNVDKTGQFIKTLREKENMTQQNLAEKIHISRQAVSKWELGKGLPDHMTLLKLSEIFNVSIDELLAGEKNTKEKVSLNLYKERNKILQKMKLLIVIIFLILLLFLGYYFVNQYNSTKVYKIYGKNEFINIENGLFIETKEKIYFNLGNIESKDEIEKIAIIYKKENEEVTIYSTDALQIAFNDYIGYEEYFNFNNLKEIKNNLYVKIFFDNKQYETKLIFEEDYKNSNFLFFKKTKIDEQDSNINVNFTNDIQIVNRIKDSFKYENNTYTRTIKEGEYNYIYTYSENTNILTINLQLKANIKEDYVYDLNTNIITYVNYENNYSFYHSFNEKIDECLQGICDDYSNKVKKFQNIVNKIL